jgi:hypothetical protein
VGTVVASINNGFDLELDPTRVREELERVLASPKFRKSQSHCEFLRFVVEKQLKASSIREEEIGVSIYRRGAGYDPDDDAIVRVEASRLRARLKEYYEDAGEPPKLRFDLPKGTLSPRIVVEGAESAKKEGGIWLWTGILVAILGMLILAGVAWRTAN